MSAGISVADTRHVRHRAAAVTRVAARGRRRRIHRCRGRRGCPRCRRRRRHGGRGDREADDRDRAEREGQAGTLPHARGQGRDQGDDAEHGADPHGPHPPGSRGGGGDRDRDPGDGRAVGDRDLPGADPVGGQDDLVRLPDGRRGHDDRRRRRVPARADGRERDVARGRLAAREHHHRHAPAALGRRGDREGERACAEGELDALDADRGGLVGRGHRGEQRGERGQQDDQGAGPDSRRGHGAHRSDTSAVDEVNGDDNCSVTLSAFHRFLSQDDTPAVESSGNMVRRPGSRRPRSRLPRTSTSRPR